MLSDRKEKYTDFLKEVDSPSIFVQPWWLDTVCGKESWQVILIERDNRVVASLPIYTKKKIFYNLISSPPLTQTLQPLFKINSQTKNSAFDTEMKLLNELVLNIPRTSLTRLNLDSRISNWLPFYWEGYSQTTFYSYAIDLDKGEDFIWKNMSGKRRTDIRKSIKSEVIIRDDLDMESFYPLYKKTFERKGQKARFKKSLLLRLEQAVKENKSGTLLIAEDKDGTPLSGAFLIWDSVKTYYLLGGLNSDLDTKGSQSLLLWEAIKLASNYSRIFDFEGSMDKSIEYFFRSFGSEQVQYFGIQRNNSFLARLLLNLKD